MSDYTQPKTDRRITKTRLALKNSLFSLLENHPFGKITVNGLCDKAYTSRATFYVNFKDKYDLLEYCFEEIKSDFEIYMCNHAEKEVIEKLNDVMRSNARVFMNLVDQANTELMSLLMSLLSPYLTKNLSAAERDANTMTDSHVALLHFCAGGMANLLIWQIKNDFPMDNDKMTEYLYHLQMGIEKWDLDWTCPLPDAL